MRREGHWMNRRSFLRSTLAAIAASTTGAVARRSAYAALESSFADHEALPAFPENFLFGASTSSVQIEGAAREDGKGESIWDRYASIPGKIADGSTPDIACDSYHRWPDDISLLKQMNLQSYRFSLSWPRVFPQGKGTPNQKGLDHYSRLIDALLAVNIRPLITSYHWDLPQPLEDAGGWPNRDTAGYFADYVGLLARTYGDRVHHWGLMNEPQAFTVVGYGWGTHAPGRADRTLMLRACHTANLAQGLGFRAIKAQNSKLQIGTTYDYDLGRPRTDSEADRAAWERYDAFRNLWFIDPVFTGRYPDAFVDGVPFDAMNFKPGDETTMKVPLDYSGVNFYCGYEYFAVGQKQKLLRGLNAHAETPANKFDYEAVQEVMLWFSKCYQRPIEITECGYNDERDAPGPDGKIHDPMRIEYLHGALTGLRKALLAGANVRSFHVWSLLDNWEWSSGYVPRMGLTYVDYKKKQARILKESGKWYGRVALSREIPNLHEA